MGEWTSVDMWHQCAEMARGNTVAEVRNADGQTLLTNCGDGVPRKPWDWKSGPVEFRIVPAPAPRRSDPIPPPPRR